MAPLQVIAMHGWVSDSTQWQPWQEAITARGWTFQTGERGYGTLPPVQPSWRPEGRRVLMAHSMGPHLVNAQALEAADAVVLLASFGRFVPPGRAGRALRTALGGMVAALDEPREAHAMLRRFLKEAAAPDPIEAMAPGPADGPLTPIGLERLRVDLQLLEQIQDLPEAFPRSVPVLIVEAGADQILTPDVRALLRDALPGADRLELPNAGHALLKAPVLAPVLAWLEQQVRP